MLCNNSQLAINANGFKSCDFPEWVVSFLTNWVTADGIKCTRKSWYLLPPRIIIHTYLQHTHDKWKLKPTKLSNISLFLDLSGNGDTKTWIMMFTSILVAPVAFLLVLFMFERRVECYRGSLLLCVYFITTLSSHAASFFILLLCLKIRMNDRGSPVIYL